MNSIIKTVYRSLCLALVWPALLCVVNAQGPTNASTEQLYKLVPVDGVGCLSIRLQQMKNDQALQLFPWEIVTAFSLDELGIDIATLDRFDLLFGPFGEAPVAAGVVTSSKPINLGQLNKENFSQLPDGKTYAPIGRDFRNFRLSPLNDKQVAVYQYELLQSFLDAKRGDGELLKQMKRLGDSGHASLVVRMEPLRPILLESTRQATPEFMAASQVLIEKIDLIAARAQLDVGNPTVNILLETASDADAAAVAEAWDDVVRFIAFEISRDFTRGGMESATDGPVRNYIGRVNREARSLLKPTQKGNRLLITLDQRAINLFRGVVTMANFSQTYTRFLNPSGGPPRPRTPNTDTDKLKAHTLAIHNFESTFKRLPGGLFPAGNMQQFSWRVRLLPFYGDPKLTALYQQFKFDELWDSEANSKLIAQMPPIYRYSKAKVPAGHTVFQMPLGPGLISEPEKSMRFADVLDGLSNTIMVAVATDEAAVPWTKPDDFNPLENLDLVRRDKNQILVGMGDGSVTALPADTSPAKLKALFSRAGADSSE